MSIRRGFHALIKNVSLSNMWGLTILPSLGASVFVGLRSLLRSMWDPQSTSHPPTGPSVLAGTPTRVHSPSRLSLLADTTSGT